MRVPFPETRPTAPGRRAALLAALLVAAACALTALAVRAPAASLRDQLHDQRQQLDRVEQRHGDVSSQIDALNAQVDTLLGEVSKLRLQREEVQRRLELKQAELDQATAALAVERRRLEAARAQLRRSLVVLRRRLVSIYMAGTPDTLSVVLNADSWSDVVARSEYVQQVEDYDNAVIGRVRTLRDEAQTAVERLRTERTRIRSARDAIAAQESELAETEASLDAQRAELASAEAERQSLLDSLAGRAEALKGSVSDLSDRIAEQSAADSTSAPAAAPPVPGSAAELLPNGQASPPADAPAAVQAAIAAANQIASTPYIWGGGHGSFDSPGYDCSGAVSFALHGGGFLDSPLDSTGLEFWGEPGAGSWITVYANSGHAFAVIAGLRWDTSGDSVGTGPRWHTDMASTAGFIARHPAGY
jgi:peptidoglycan hydrolase CwlO-like protein